MFLQESSRNLETPNLQFGSPFPDREVFVIEPTDQDRVDGDCRRRKMQSSCFERRKHEVAVVVVVVVRDLHRDLDAAVVERVSEL